MSDYDVFNGDADGICSLVQLRLNEPRKAKLVTGVKRKIDLLEEVDAKDGDRITVLDVSMEKNTAALERALSAGASVFYADHHRAGDIPNHPKLDAHIDTSSEICTALIIDKLLKGAHRAWTVTAAFGDNFLEPARKAAVPLDLTVDELFSLERLGTLINYNGYGASIEDLHFTPEDLFRQLVPFATPMAFMAENADVFGKLDQGYIDDMNHAENATVVQEDAAVSVRLLSNAPASRRVSGVYGNALAQAHKSRAHAILTDKGDGGYVVSVNHLPEADVEKFVAAFEAAYRS